METSIKTWPRQDQKTIQSALAFLCIAACALFARMTLAAPAGQVLFSPSITAAAIVPDSALVIGRAVIPPTLDGVIQAGEWAAAGTGAFSFNGDATKATTVYALYDAQNLYLAFRCLEPDASKIRAASGPGKNGKFAPDAAGDCGQVFADDSIEIFISPDARQQVVYQLIANTIGGQLDIRHDLPKMDAAYTSGFKSAARVQSGCWSIEFAIPLKAIGVEKVVSGQTALRVNFGRNRAAGPESAAWQGFWAWQGPMPQAVLAPAAPFAIGAVRYGQRYVGLNEATLEIRSSAAKAAKVRLVAKVVQEKKSSTLPGGEVSVNAGEVARITAPYAIARADVPFDLVLSVEGVDAAVGVEEQGLLPEPPIAATLERASYRRVDGPATVFFNLNLNPDSLKDYRLRCALLDGGQSATGQLAVGQLTVGQPVATVESALQAGAGEVRFTLDGKEPAQYEVALSLIDGKGQENYVRRVGPIAWAGDQVKPAADLPAANLPVAGKLALKLDVFQKIQGQAERWPVIVGIPFAKGVLASEANVRLLSPAGAEVPIEVSVPATWDRGRSSIRWLHLKCLVALEDAGKSYTLEYGPDVKRAAAPAKLKTSQTADAIIVDTGRLKFQCGKRPFRFIDAAWLDRNGDGKYTDDERVVVTGPDSGLLVETVEGQRFRSDATLDWPEVEKVELESVGPVEAVIRVEGWHKATPQGTTPQGATPERMMKYVVRLVATADTSLLRVFHSFVLTENEDVQYRQVTMGFSLPDEETSVADHQAREPVKLTAGAEIALLQVDHDAYRLQMRTPERGPSLVALANGEKSEGWLMVQRKGWGLTLATRDFWQNYAKGYEVRRDAITLCPWPKDALSPLSFRPEDVIAPIFVKRLAYTTTGLRFGDGGNYSTYTYGTGTKPLGVSKTHEYLLEFTTTPSLARSRMVQQLLNDPPLLIVAPEYAGKTGVFGKIAPYNKEKYPVEEAGFKAMLGRLEYGKPEHRHWGLVNFGESYQSTGDTGEICVYRTYQNAGYGIVNDFYRGYLRSGDRDWLRYAVRRTRHNRDLDHCQYGPKAGGQTEYDTLNWGTNFELITFWTHRLFLLQDWYMTGDRRSWDTFLLACEAVAKTNPGSGPKDDRAWFNQPKELIYMYEATWNPRFLEMAKAVVDGILLAKAQSGADTWPPGTTSMPEYLQPSLLVYHQFAQDPRVLAYLKAYLTNLKGRQNYATGKGQDLAAYLYWVTGDVAWLELVGGYEGMRDYMRLWETSVPPPVGGLRRNTVSEALTWTKTWSVKQKTVFHDGFADKGFHHTWERLWYFMAAVDDARAKGTLKPYQGTNNPWSEPIWDADYWKTVSPEKAKEYGW